MNEGGARVVESPVGWRIELGGRFQGVGFRPWVHGLVRASGIRGRVFNTGSRVIVEAFADPDVLETFVGWLSAPPMLAAAAPRPPGLRPGRAGRRPRPPLHVVGVSTSTGGSVAPGPVRQEEPRGTKAAVGRS